MKDPSESKTRLSEFLSFENRCNLSKILFTRTLEILFSIKSGDRGSKFDVAVVTSSEEIGLESKKKDFFLIKENSSNSLCEALQTSAKWALASGYTAICVLPADLIAPTSNEITLLIDKVCETQSVIICPAHDFGTNALVVSPPTAIPFCYGKQSFFNHIRAARTCGIEPIILPLISFQYDLDEINDLDYLIQLEPSFASLKKN